MKKFITLSVLALAFSTGLASAASRVDDYCEAALSHMQKGEYKQAQGYLAEAFKMEPGNEKIAVALAYVSNQAGDFDTAIIVGQHIVEKINGNNSIAFREVGWACALKAAVARKNGNSTEASQFGDLATTILAKSLNLNKNDKATWDYLIAHLDAIGEREAAEQVRQARNRTL